VISGRLQASAATLPGVLAGPEVPRLVEDFFSEKKCIK